MEVEPGMWLPAIMGGAEVDASGQSDLDAVNAHIKGQVETYFNEMKSREALPTQQTEQKDQLKDLIAPYIDPGMNQARFDGADAKDYVKFYTQNHDVAEYNDEIEKMFKGLADAGRATSRTDILHYLRGKEYSTDKDKFVEKITAKQKEQVEKAKGAVDIGQSSVDRARNDPIFATFDKLSLEEMEKALDGVVF